MQNFSPATPDSVDALRRHLLRAAGASTAVLAMVSAGLLRPQQVLAAEWAKGAFTATTFTDALKAHASNGSSESRDIAFIAPEITQIAQLFPGPTPDKNRTVLNYLRREPIRDEADRANVEAAMNFFRDVTYNEDYVIGLEIHAQLSTSSKLFSSAATAYGAAGSLVVFLLWIYYSSIILFASARAAVSRSSAASSSRAAA